MRLTTSTSVLVDDEQKPDRDEIGGDQRHVGARHRLEKQKAHARPLEHGLGEQRIGQHVADLQTAKRHERKQSVAQRMVQPHPQARRALGPRGAHIVGAELIEHGGAHEPDEQRQHDGGERNRRQHQMLEPVKGEQPRLPKSDAHRLRRVRTLAASPSHTEKMEIRMMPVRKTGTEMPSTLKPKMSLAPKDRGFTAQ